MRIVSHGNALHADRAKISHGGPSGFNKDRSRPLEAKVPAQTGGQTGNRSDSGSKVVPKRRRAYREFAEARMTGAEKFVGAAYRPLATRGNQWT